MELEFLPRGKGYTLSPISVAEARVARENLEHRARRSQELNASDGLRPKRVARSLAHTLRAAELADFGKQKVVIPRREASMLATTLANTAVELGKMGIGGVGLPPSVEGPVTSDDELLVKMAGEVVDRLSL